MDDNGAIAMISKEKERVEIRPTKSNQSVEVFLLAIQT